MFGNSLQVLSTNFWKLEPGLSLNGAHHVLHVESTRFDPHHDRVVLGKIPPDTYREGIP